MDEDGAVGDGGGINIALIETFFCVVKSSPQHPGYCPAAKRCRQGGHFFLDFNAASDSARLAPVEDGVAGGVCDATQFVRQVIVVSQSSPAAEDALTPVSASAQVARNFTSYPACAGTRPPLSPFTLGASMPQAAVTRNNGNKLDNQR